MDASGPLSGSRIAITRSRERGSELARHLEALGAEVLTLPAISIAPPGSWQPLDFALRSLKQYAWLVFTSANAVRAVGERLGALNPVEVESARGALAALQVAAVGRATAQAAEALGCANVLLPQRFVAEALAEALAGRVHGERVLLVRAESARDVLPEALRAAGAEVEIVPAYRTVLPAGAAPEVRDAFARNPPHAAVFASSSAVRNFLALLAEAGVERPADLRAISIGPITSATLREAGWEPSAEARLANLDSLAEACVAARGEFQSPAALPQAGKGDHPASPQRSR
jgi:uroporphyrinogen-III synthase